MGTGVGLGVGGGTGATLTPPRRAARAGADVRAEKAAAQRSAAAKSRQKNFLVI
jgi:hypothetical protein